MKAYLGINEIYTELTQTGKMVEYIEAATEAQVLLLVEAIFEQGLRGTCINTWKQELDAYGISIKQLFEKVEENDVLTALDDVVFECDGCGWWCGVDESNSHQDENYCDQCIEDVKEDEDYDSEDEDEE